jgi:hypothetical protein
MILQGNANPTLYKQVHVFLVAYILRFHVLFNVSIFLLLFAGPGFDLGK